MSGVDTGGSGPGPGVRRVASWLRVINELLYNGPRAGEALSEDFFAQYPDVRSVWYNANTEERVASAKNIMRELRGALLARFDIPADGEL